MPDAKQLVPRFAGDTGAEIAEAALVLPLVMMMALGIVWFGRAFNIYSTITQAAQQGAIAAARYTCVSCGDTAASNVAVDNTIIAVMQASRLDPTRIQAAPTPSFPACPSPPAPPGGCVLTGKNVWICRNVQLDPLGAAQPPQCGSVISFQYPFQFYLPFTSLNLQQVVMSAQSMSRMEY